ncbi:MAG: ATP-binding protein [Muribaculaceae bacterium]|nr:ATP-binding protein [Muribaculaceae bacterium]
MKICIENIGLIKWAEFSPSNLTIICGDNNSGKTYATYAWFGFLDFFKRRYKMKIDPDFIRDFIKSGSSEYSVNRPLSHFNKIIAQACNDYISYLPSVFATSPDFFKEAKFNIILEKSDIKVKKSFNARFQNKGNEVVQIIKKADNENIHFSWLNSDSNEGGNASFKSLLAFIFSDVIKKVLFDNTFPEVFVTSAERTGAAVFKKDINTSSPIRDAQSENVISRYPLPVVRNVDFINNLDIISKRYGELSHFHPEIMNAFIRISGGEYEAEKNSGMVFFLPSGSKAKYAMAQSASSVRALLDLYFYIKHLASENQLLIIDEPELNLHPSRQILLARLLTMLVNCGLKVMITTHSDYILREINNMMILNSKKNHQAVNSLLSKYDIPKKSLIDSERVSLYIAKKDLVKLKDAQRRKRIDTLVEIDKEGKYGFTHTVFDKILEEAAALQRDIIFSDYES